ncbi:MAG: hypothetical protein KDB69_02750 [Acidimicrobiia bacterium]|nr:hypothetical protein [Acidimicrobiia bacterium]
MLRITSFLLMVGIVLVGVALPAVAATPSCGDLYPEARWDVVDDGPVRIEVSDMTKGLAARFDDEIGMATGWIVDEVGPVELTICLVDEASAFDRDRYRNGSEQFHVVSDLDRRFVAMDTRRQTKFVAPAMAFAVSQHALFQNNGGPFPEPLASTIGYWYRARTIEQLPYDRRTQRGANLFSTDARIEWTAGSQEPVRAWDPERNESSIGAFIDYVVDRHGPSVMLDTTPQTWADLEAEWRTSMRIDLTGSANPTTGWRVGAAMVVGVVVIGSLMAGVGIYRKHRRRDHPETPEPIPGFFVDSGA